jgi:putative NIF3 family GTP cyclohydrolase 1 type 2
LLTLHEPVDLDTIAQRLRTHLGVDALRMVRSGDAHHTVIGCCPGAGGSMVADAVAHGATLFVTGEMRHHDLLEAKANGVSVLLAGHTNTERGYLPILCDRLNKACPSITSTVSHTDTTPWVTV